MFIDFQGRINQTQIASHLLIQIAAVFRGKAANKKVKALCSNKTNKIHKKAEILR